MTTANELIAQGEGVADEALVESTLESLINAKSALVLANAGLSYAVKGKTTIVGVAVQDADITVTVNGKSYTTHSDEITGEFTVEATALTASSVINVDVERKGLASETYSYNMSNGDITSYIPPTTTQTQPTTTSTTKPTTVTTTTKPTTVTTTTKPTTATTVTEPTGILGDVNGDGVVNVKDATAIQKYAAEMTVELNLKLADYNKDGCVNVKDATDIQKTTAFLN